LAVTEQNLRLCGAAAAAYALHRAGAYDWLEARRARESGAPLIVLADPPYATDLAERLLAALARWPASGLLAAVVEHGADGAPAPPESGPWRIRRRVYGHSALTILEA
jgi:16S rRNA G966 N2-methylase RsmD